MTREEVEDTQKLLYYDDALDVLMRSHATYSADYHLTSHVTRSDSRRRDGLPVTPSYGNPGAPARSPKLGLNPLPLTPGPSLKTPKLC